LQELLALENLVFFDQEWTNIGTKTSLEPHLSSVTGIGDFMSFRASGRETTQIEDRACSLMGLFGVNMPPLYGEGRNAFVRLQLEILRSSDEVDSYLLC